ncbi:MAG: NAD(+)--rifampin ADP-ribosyltransferase [Maritimibacter sp.]
MKKVFDASPFYHGTKAELRIGDLLVAGRRSNFRSEIVMNHIYFFGTTGYRRIGR